MDKKIIIGLTLSVLVSFLVTYAAPKGEIFVGTGASNVGLFGYATSSVGQDGLVLMSSSSATNGISWEIPVASTTAFDSTVTYMKKDVITGIPASADCNATSSLGRTILVVTTTVPRNRVYMCGYTSGNVAGWASSTLTN